MQPLAHPVCKQTFTLLSTQVEHTGHDAYLQLLVLCVPLCNWIRRAAANVLEVCFSFLRAAAELARKQWTQFNMPLMLLGLLLFTLCLLLQAHTLWSSLAPRDNTVTTLPTQRWQLLLPAGGVFLGLLHAAGLFSISFLLAEGWMVCCLVATLSVLLLHATVAATLQQSSAGMDIHALSGSCCSWDSRGTCNRLHALEPGAARAPGLCGKDRGATRPDKAGQHATTVAHSTSPNLQVNKRFTQQKRWDEQCSYAVLWGAGLLVCNALMGSMGLVVRTGHDAMHKAAPAQGSAQHTGTDSLPDLVVSDVGNWSTVRAVASAQWLSAAVVQTQDLLAPLVCALIFPFVLLHANTHPAATAGVHHSTQRLQQLVLQSVWFAYLVLAVYWIIAQAGQQDASLSSLLQPALSAASSSFLGRSVTLFFISVANYAPSFVYLFSRGLHQPVLLLMPRLVFLSSTLSFVALLMSKAKEQWQPRGAARHYGGSNAYPFIAALAAPILLVCGPTKGLVCALCLLECTCVVKLLQYLQTHCNPSSPGDGSDATRCTPESWLGVAEGCLWALLSMQLFFCSGHFCEFAGLQYAAGNHFHFTLYLGITSNSCLNNCFRNYG